MAKQGEVDQLNAEIAILTTQLTQKETALKAARVGLFRIIDAKPARFMRGPGGSGQELPIVKCLDHIKTVADTTVLKMSDAENDDG